MNSILIESLKSAFPRAGRLLAPCLIAIGLAGACEVWAQGCQPPFAGTIFINPDIITPDDPSAFSEIVYAGRAARQMFDRRVDGWITVQPFLFNTFFDDGFVVEVQVNPEFGSPESAMTQAERYARVIGRLPAVLRRDVETVWIHRGVEPFGGGNNNLLIHTGQAQEYIGAGILEETLAHEAAHTSLDAEHAAAPGWLQAQAADDCFISLYARDLPHREDIAESFLPYLAVRYRSDRISAQLKERIEDAIPNRIAYFDGLELDLYPFGDTRPALHGAMSGMWYDRGRSGEGFVIEFARNAPGPIATLFWFTHMEGRPYWLMGTTEYEDGQRGIEFELLEVSGTGFGADFDSDEVERHPWGRIRVEFESCTEGRAEWESDSGLGGGELDLRRITAELDGAECAGDVASQL